jgi:hypothetical protein
MLASGLAFFWFVFGGSVIAGLFAALFYSASVFQIPDASRALAFAGFFLLPAAAGGCHRSWKVFPPTC